MKKNAWLIGALTAAVFAVGSANAQGFAVAPKKPKPASTTIGVPQAPPIAESCMSMPNGTVECEQTICQQIGSNYIKECTTYTFIVENYNP